MRMWPLLLVVCVLGVVGAGSCKPRVRRVATTAPEGRVVGRMDLLADRFGVVGRTSGDNATRLLDELGVGWIRIPVNWAQVEPRPGVRNWNQVLKAVQSQARTRPGMRVIVTLRAKSPWAGGTGKQAHERATLPPRSLDDYYQLVYGMAERGKGVVDCWQIENEMEGQSWWAGTAEEYVELLRTAARAVRSADPTARVMLGGFTSEMSTVAALAYRGRSKREIAEELGADASKAGTKAEARIRRNVEFIDYVLAHAGPHFDIVDIHLYNRYQTIPTRVEWLRAKMRENGYEKPIWATEVGGPDPLLVRHDASVQSEEVVKRVVLALASGVEKVFWLGLTEMPDQGERFARMGLSTTKGKRKPAFYAYQLTIRKLEGLPFRSSLQVPQGYAFRFAGSGRGTWVLWADGGSQFRLDTGGADVVVTDLGGNTRRLAASGNSVQLSLTSSPVFVEEMAE